MGHKCMWLMLVIFPFTRVAGAVDWKIIASGDVDSHVEFLFYDAESVNKAVPTHPTVWAMAVTQTELVRVMKTVGVDATKVVAKKIEEGYVPPIATLIEKEGNADTEEITKFLALGLRSAVLMEVVANMEHFADYNKILYEFDCVNDKFRGLSAIMATNGKLQQSDDSDSPDQWDNTSAFSHIQHLAGLICPAKH